MLRENQKKAIETSINNNFESGIHFHATGTGKSHIALSLLFEYHTRYPNKSNILWICEQKSILIEQFNKDTLKKKGYSDVLKKFIIYDYTINKPSNWYDNINSSIFWKKPILVIINRAFLTYDEKYKKCSNIFNLIIHDECHTIVNNTTTKFYEHILEKNNDIKCIGFSATPHTEIKPYTNIISSYSIFDAYKDDIIVKPKIVWLKSNTKMTYENTKDVLKELFDDLPYKKIIVWCGMIELCKEIANIWKKDAYFNNWVFSIDTSENNENESEYHTYEYFNNCESHGILFCAAKHREGSDIKNLDGCIFLDGVEDRNSKTFVQCMGRVLRQDIENKKKYGLIVDISAFSSIKICDRINTFLNNDLSIFPFEYTFSFNKNNIQINVLEMTKGNNILTQTQLLSCESSDDIKKYFIRTVPDTKEYTNRLDMELKMFYSKNLTSYLLQAVEILNITKNIPHVTRGSCGSSLVCYLLGISHVDPIKWRINFARFLNEYRTTLPDIDFDFPYNLRDEVFLQIQLRWSGKVARISNHIYYHEKSATREALRRAGIHTMIPKSEIYKTINNLPKKVQKFIDNETKKLEDTFKCYSLHCGGIVFYPDGIPDDILMKDLKYKTSIPQISLNKKDIASEQNFKIDILSSRALAQLYEICDFKLIDFEAYDTDELTSKLFESGDNIGITLAESPLMRKAFLKFKPKTINDIAMCLAIIRPAAKDARDIEEFDKLEQCFIYDDDAIQIIANAASCSFADADRYRRGICKNDKEVINELKKELIKKKVSNIDFIFESLSNLQKYSFCKSHAYSYAQLVWCLGYMKAHYPYKFWLSTLKHNSSSYRKWVHIYEARLAGININNDTQKHKSIYGMNRKKNMNEDNKLYLKNNGIWNIENLEFFPNCFMKYIINHKNENFNGKYKIRGLIASSKLLSYKTTIKKAILFVCYAPRKYLEIYVTGKKIYNLNDMVGITCRCKMVSFEEKIYETSDNDFVLW